MIFYIFIQGEEHKHDLTSSTCQCHPKILVVRTGDILLVHGELDEATIKEAEVEIEKFYQG